MKINTEKPIRMKVTMPVEVEVLRYENSHGKIEWGFRVSQFARPLYLEGERLYYPTKAKALTAARAAIREWSDGFFS